MYWINVNIVNIENALAPHIQKIIINIWINANNNMKIDKRYKMELKQNKDIFNNSIEYKKIELKIIINKENLF